MTRRRNRSTPDDPFDAAPRAAAAGPLDAAALGQAHVRGSTLLLVGRVIALVFTVTTQVVLVRALSTTDFGSFAYALALVAGGQVLMSLGQGKMLSRFASVFEEERDYGRMFGSIFLAIGTIIATSTVAIGAVYGFAEPLADLAGGGQDTVKVLLVLVLLAPMEALDQVFVALFATFSEPRSIFFRKYLLTPILRLTVVLLVVASGGSLAMLAIGYVGSQLVGLLVAGAFLIRLFKVRGLWRYAAPRHLKLPFRTVFAFSVPTLTTEMAHISMTTGSVMILGAVRGITDVAGYRAVWPAARLNQFVFSSFTTLFTPMAARLHARGETQALRTAYWHTAVFLAVCSYPVFAMTVIFAPQTTVALFGERYAGSADALALLALGYYVNVSLGFNIQVLSVFGRLRYVIGVNATVTVLNLLLSFVLIPPHGILGVAVANCVTLVIQNLLNQAGLRRCIGTVFIDRSCLRPYGLIVVATGALATVRVLLSPGVVVSAVLVVVVSLMLLRLTRNWLKLDATVPQLLAVPGVGRFLGSTGRS